MRKNLIFGIMLTASKILLVNAITPRQGSYRRGLSAFSDAILPPFHGVHMHEFETFVFLDIEKTGTGFISTLLKKFSSEKEIRRDHHARMGPDFDPAKFYFISVRHPLDAYISSYSFGCLERGRLRTQLESQGHDHFYDRTTKGFNTWLRFVLNPDNVEILGGGFGHKRYGYLAGLIGYQTFCYLQLALPDARPVLAECRTKDDVRKVHEELKLPKFTIRYESFAADLKELLQGPLRHAIGDLDGALRFIDSGYRVNASKRVDKEAEDFELRGRLPERLREREWFLYEQFGYGEQTAAPAQHYGEAAAPAP
jgi:hypothetical protein